MRLCNVMEWNGMESWNHGMEWNGMESWNGITESWNHRIMESQNHGIQITQIIEP